MKQSTVVKGALALCAAALLAPAALADANSLHSYYDGTPQLGVTPPANFGAGRDVLPGDTYGSNILILGGANQQLMDSAPDTHTVGAFENMGTSAIDGRDMYVLALQSNLPDGSQQIVVEWGMMDGGPILPQGGVFGPANDIVQLISFQLGNAANTIDTDGIDVGNFEYKHPEDPANPGTFLANFELLNGGGADLLGGGGNFFVNAGGGDVSGVVFIQAGGADLGNFDITIGRATITLNKVPAPGALALLGIAGVIGSRRRRS